MPNKKLIQWIQSAKIKGYSQQQLKYYLLQRGFKPKDIDGAIYLSEHQSNFNEFIKPSFFKISFPILFLILIVISFTINSFHIPPFAEWACKSTAGEQEAINNAQAQFLNHGVPIFLGNFYFIISKIYRLNPFFPIPCEVGTFLEKEYDNYICSYYMGEKEYNCIADYISQTEQQGSAIWLPEISNELLPYKKINHITLIINSLILLVVIYLIVCSISFVFKVITHKNNKIKFIAVSILLVLPILLKFLGFIYPLFFYPFIIIFSILIFIKKESNRKLVMSILFALLILLLIAGIFAISYFVRKMIIETAIYR